MWIVLYTLFCVISSLFVYRDALRKRFVTPFGWFLMVLFFPVPFLPLYFWIRPSRYVELEKEARR